MAQLDATTTDRPNLLTDPNMLDNIVRAGAPDLSGLGPQLGDWLSDQNDYRDAKIAERQAAGVTPSPGPVDWNAILYDLNAPMRERGVEFEGPVDWGGIGAAIGDTLGGIGGVFAGQPGPSTKQNIPTNNGGLIERDKAGIIDPQTGFVKDPVTGTWYRPDYSPVPERLTAEPVDKPGPNTPQQAPFIPSPNFSGFDVLGNLAAGMAAEERRLGAGINGLPVTPNLPRPRPQRAGLDPVQPAMATDPWDEPVMPPSASNPAPAQPLPGMVPGAQPIQPATPQEQTVWQNAVDMAGGLLENTPLGGAVQHLFPDFWYGAGETLKGATGAGSGSLADTGGGYDRWGTSTSPRESLSPSTGGYDNGRPDGDFIDLNKNGIDDRDEGIAPVSPVVSPTQPGGGVPISYLQAFFPDLPPYNPGVDAEWQYFRPAVAPPAPAPIPVVQPTPTRRSRREYAEGGIVDAVASQSPNGTPPVGGLDPRITIIADAEDALEGEHPKPEEAIALFVQMFGEDALEILKTNVSSGRTLNGYQRKKPRMAKGRFIDGEGGDKDDQVPARIDDVEEARLSNGEFVVTAPAVRAAGDGDPMKGAAKLSQLDAMLAGRDDDGLDVERVR